MSYMRGDAYIWSDGDRVHFWMRDGYDGWDEAGWHEPTEGRDASGVALRQEVADEYVVMRFAQMLDEGSVCSAIDRALRQHSGNGGCLALDGHGPLIRELSARVLPKPGAV